VADEAKAPAPGQMMVFELYGGPCDGGEVVYPLLAEGEVYLLAVPRITEPVRDVYAFSFANRSNPSTGNWILQHERYIGMQGVPNQPTPKKEEKP
jgi:hypothetical protein